MGDSFFRNIIGERDPIMTESRTTPPATPSSGIVREWRIMAPEDCSLTRLDVMVGTTALVGTARQASIRVSYVPSATRPLTWTKKGLMVCTLAATAYSRRMFLPSATITLPAGAMVGFAVSTYTKALGTAVGVKFAVYLTSGFRA